MHSYGNTLAKSIAEVKRQNDYETIKANNAFGKSWKKPIKYSLLAA
jgi:hypothetical protein